MSSPTATARPGHSGRQLTEPRSGELRSTNRPDLRPSLESGSSVPLPWYPMGRRAAMFSFVTEIVGLTAVQFDEYKGAPGAQDVLPIVAATLPREAEALTSA